MTRSAVNIIVSFVMLWVFTTPYDLMAMTSQSYQIQSDGFVSAGGDAISESYKNTEVAVGLVAPVNYITLTVTYGDVNGDSNINVFDALLTLQYAVGLYTPPDLLYFKTAADVAPLDTAGKPSGNGKVDVFDALAILRNSVGLDLW